MPAEKVHLVLNSRVSWLDVIQGVSEDLGLRVGLDEDDRFKIAMALREGVNNAILHGNRHDQEKLVEVTFLTYPDRLEVRIKDEGTGFDTSELPDPTEPQNILSPSGRGVFLIRNFMDNVDLTRVGRRGCEIRMSKWLPGRGGASEDRPSQAADNKRGSTSP